MKQTPPAPRSADTSEAAGEFWRDKFLALGESMHGRVRTIARRWACLAAASSTAAAALGYLMGRAS